LKTLACLGDEEVGQTRAKDVAGVRVMSNRSPTIDDSDVAFEVVLISVPIVSG
jgi:hypothetical protein